MRSRQRSLYLKAIHIRQAEIEQRATDNSSIMRV